MATETAKEKRKRKKRQAGIKNGDQATKYRRQLLCSLRIFRAMHMRQLRLRKVQESGARALYVSPSFLKNIAGLHPRESEQLLTLLFEHVIRPEYTVRFKWQEGSLAFWDNRSTAHLAPVDINDAEFDRQLYRITLVGDVPVGPDGKPSVRIDGEPVLAHSVE